MILRKYKYKENKIYWESSYLPDKITINKKRIRWNKSYKNKRETNIKIYFFIFIVSLLFLALVPLFKRNNASYQLNKIFEKKINKTSTLENFLFNDQNDEYDRPISLPFKRFELYKYRVKKGDTLESISKKFEITIETIVLANNFKKYQNVKPGDILFIPNQNGRLITIKENDTILNIAKTYGVEWQKIVDANDLKSSKIFAGTRLFIPGAQMTLYEKNKFYTQEFIWPLRGKITSYFGSRIDPFTKIYSFHSGIDIKGDKGEKVKCVKDGKVVFTGFHNVYGNFVLVKHLDGVITNYAHLEKVNVNENDEIKQGDIIGYVGDSGRTTGVHLHFEIIKNGKFLNPLLYLK